ncbi:hypothetical protein T02_13512 [Trichinella nativa]|uniref:Uncharacterized protein n=1 Tax=Trichinella nativa TaxID=6335 RepID=A0A0V1KN15_9BILA|nr:hypothetical protein T02_13512 [Trichinella nativa]
MYTHSNDFTPPNCFTQNFQQNIKERCVESSADPQTQRSVESASSIYYPSLVYLAPFVNRAKTDSGIVAERTPLAGSPF